MQRWSRACALGAVLLGALMSCGPNVVIPPGETGGGAMPIAPPVEDGPSADLVTGGSAVVIADSLNMRDKPGVDNDVVTAMPCGATVAVNVGPSTDPNPGWWNISYVADDGTTYKGWATGKFMIDSRDFDPASCGFVVAPATDTDDGGDDPFPTDDGGYDYLFDLSNGAQAPDLSGVIIVPVTSEADMIFARAKLAVGYSYWWGHGAWRTDHTSVGSCSGVCPSCTHGGSFGADCSGFVAKVWQVPGPSALSVDQHPYSTTDFYSGQANWRQISRSSIKAADALVHEGHIVLFESGNDPYGAMWIYEARGCASGIVHANGTLDSSYHAIRRNGL